MKANTVNQETQATSTAHTFPTPDYFFPDFINCDPDQIILPSFDEMMFLGQENLREIRSYMRGEERKAKNMLVEATAIRDYMSNITLHDLQHAVSPSEIDSGHYIEAELLSSHENGHVVMCDWHGGATQECLQLFSTMNDKSTETIKATNAQIDQLIKEHHHCRYGEFVAKWCARTPKCESSATLCAFHSSDIVPIIVAGKTQPIEAHKAEVVKACPHYHECMEATQPYLDQPCLLANGDEATLQSCRDYLSATVQLWSKRVKLLAKYIGQLSAAIKQAESKPLFANWRRDTNWTYLSRISSPVVYVRFPTAVGRINQFLSNHPPKLQKMDSIAVEYADTYHFHSISDPLLCTVDELLYLLEHRDYLEKVWVDWSLANYMEPEEMRPEILQRFNTISAENIEFLKKMLHR